MSYQLRRINPYWISHPMIPTVVAIGGILAVMGYMTGRTTLALAGVAAAGIAVFLGTRPVVSAILAVLGLFGGLITFIVVPNPNTVGMTVGMRALSSLLFAVFYMVLMDALVLVVSVFYNFFSGVLGMGGLRLDLEAAEETEAAEG